MLWKTALPALLILLPVAIGCGPAGPVKVPIGGSVTLDGKPLETGTVFFKTIREGSVDEMPIQAGHFEGLVEVGERRVEVSQFVQAGAAGGFPTFVDNIPPRYNVQSELTANVTKDGSHTFTFDLKSK